MSEPSSTELYEVKRTLKELSDKKKVGVLSWCQFTYHQISR